MGGDPRGGGGEEEGDGDSGDEDALDVFFEGGVELVLFFEAGGVAFDDVGEAEHDEGDDPVDEFEGGLVDAELFLAGVAEEMGDDEEAEEGEGAGEDDEGDVGGGGGTGGGDRFDPEVALEGFWQHAAPVGIVGIGGRRYICAGGSSIQFTPPCKRCASVSTEETT